MKPIAIIGMSAIFPQAENLQDYWDNILNEVDCITDVPPSRWEIADYYDPDPKAPDKSYSKRGGFIPDIDFNPFEFGLPPNILEATDVSQLLALVAAKACLEDGGYGDSEGVSRENVGVILGMVGVGSKLMHPLMDRLQYPVWDKVLKSYGIAERDRQGIIEKIKLAYPKWEENSFPGAIGNVVAGRIANRFDLGGTNCVIDAACASSLAAIRMAVGELVEGHADMMISGGVDTDNSIGAYLCFSKTPAFSPGEKVRTFDQESDGMLMGEGIGMVLMKRLEDAQRDGDRVYAVIKGVGSSSDGRYKSIYAPRPEGQSLALTRAYADAGFSPATVGLIEAHGTGTMAGDPAEFQGLNAVFSTENASLQTIALGSVKSQIGHTKAAAGVASIIKTALALHNKILPPTINVDQPNPILAIETSPFYIHTTAQPWVDPLKYPRRAGVSAFGFGGTNFHVVLEENETEHTAAYRTSSSGKVILLSAEDPQKLSEKCSQVLVSLQAPSASTFAELCAQSDVAALPPSHARLGFVANNAPEALTKLEIALDMITRAEGEESAEHPSGVFYRARGFAEDEKVVALFPGQGSQYVNMGSEVAMNFPEVRQAMAKMDALFLEDNQPRLSKTVYPISVFNQEERDAQTRKLTQTQFAQPAIGALSMGLYQLLSKAGFDPDFVAGHSFGELTALWAAGVYSDAAFLFLAKARGEAMAPPSDPDFDSGTMLAVKGDIQQLKEDLQDFPDVRLANHNANNQVVLAGTKTAIAKIQEALTEKEYKVFPLNVSAAFHTPLVAHAQKPFADALQQIKFHKPKTPVFSNSTGEEYPTAIAAMQSILKDHILNSVNFKAEIEALYAAGGRVFVEIGPKSVLTGLVNNILEGKPHVTLALNPSAKKDSDRQLREAIAQLCVLGLPLHQFDPYAFPLAQLEPQKSAVTVRLNGGLYLSEETKAAFQNAIAQQDTLEMQTPPEVHAGKSEAISLVLTEGEKIGAGNQSQEKPDSQSSIAGVSSIQEDMTSVHQKFLENDFEYSQIFSQLTQQELALLKSSSAQKNLEQINTALQTLDHSIQQFHQHQATTLRIQEQYLKNQTSLLKYALNGDDTPKTTGSSTTIREYDSKRRSDDPVRSGQVKSLTEASLSEAGFQDAPKEPSNETTASLPSEKMLVLGQKMDLELLTTSLLQIVSEKTGYSPEMLDLEMDLEADLGIDSIKRVEILGAMQASFPNLPQPEPSLLAELRTLEEIVAMLFAGSEKGIEPQNLQQPTSPSRITELQDPVQVDGGGSLPDKATLQTALLNIVSAKTGYSPEMLDLEMDLEADLGIDSIKRVEILGALQEQFPDIPAVDPSTLVEFHTLRQIIDALSLSEMMENKLDDSTLPTETDRQTTLRHIISLQSLPLPDRLVSPSNHKSTVLVTDDGGHLTTELAERLTTSDRQVVVLSLPENLVPENTTLPESIEHVVLHDVSETTLASTLKGIETSHGQIDTFIHLDPSSNGTKPFGDAEKTILKLIFFTAKHLQKSLTQVGENGSRAAFITVTRLDGQFGLSQTLDIEPLKGGYFGLTKSLNLEWDHVFCRAIDLAPDLDPQTAAGHITAELQDPNRLLSEVAYDKYGRYTLTVQASENEASI
ncbi:MAG: beta-ketoacyl synthase N-terminal-like domain-containing protein [Brevefilum sp.]|nr:beta-ketoacyl synthase N-terminal-like domain-containing protein [Brevefilum sp.]